MMLLYDSVFLQFIWFSKLYLKMYFSRTTRIKYCFWECSAA